jgi:hypothetical protein
MSSLSPAGPRKAGSVTRCVACGSRLRPEENWCSLCHHSVSAGAPARPGDEAPTPPGDEAQLGPETEPEPFLRLPAPVEPVPDPVVIAAADRLIAELAAAEAGRDRESGLGSLQDRLGARSGLVLAVGGGVMLLVIGILGLTLLGLML